MSTIAITSLKLSQLDQRLKSNRLLMFILVAVLVLSAFLAFIANPSLYYEEIFEGWNESIHRMFLGIVLIFIAALSVGMMLFSSLKKERNKEFQQLCRQPEHLLVALKAICTSAHRYKKYRTIWPWLERLIGDGGDFNPRSILQSEIDHTFSSYDDDGLQAFKHFVRWRILIANGDGTFSLGNGLLEEVYAYYGHRAREAAGTI